MNETDNRNLSCYMVGYFPRGGLMFKTLDILHKDYALAISGDRMIYIVINEHTLPFFRKGTSFQLTGANLTMATHKDGLFLGIVEVTDNKQIREFTKSHFLTDTLSEKLELASNNIALGQGKVLDIKYNYLGGGASRYMGFIRLDCGGEIHIGVFNKSMIMKRDLKAGDLIQFAATLHPSKLDRGKFKLFDITFEIIDYGILKDKQSQEDLSFESYRQLYI